MLRRRGGNGTQTILGNTTAGSTPFQARPWGVYWPVIAFLLCCPGTVAPLTSGGQNGPDVTIAVVNRRSPLHLRNCLGSVIGVLNRGELKGGGGWEGGAELSWELLVVETSGGGQGSFERDTLLSVVADFPPSRAVLNAESAARGKTQDLNVSQALEAGLRHALGEVVVWVDDSVEILPGVLRGMMSVIVGQPTVAIVGSEVCDGRTPHNVPPPCTLYQTHSLRFPIHLLDPCTGASCT